jgi:RimJ/RimL family protein N-acetyltransferase
LRRAGADPDLWRFAATNQHGGTHGGDFDAWFDQRLKAIAEQGEASWAIRDKVLGAIVGSTSYLAVVPPHKRLEVSENSG